MLFSMFTIKDTIKKLSGLNNQIKENASAEDLAIFKNKFYAIAYDLSLALGEAYTTLKNDDLNIKYNNTLMRIQNIITTESSTQMKEIIQDMITDFDDYKYSSHRKYAMNSNATYYSDNMNYEIEDTFSLEKIIEKIKCNTNRDVNVLHLDCNSGETSTLFNNISDKVKLYGNEANQFKLSRAKEIMYKAVKGVLRGSRIQNNAFDVLYAVPVITYEIAEDGAFTNKRPEKMYIMDLFKYVRQDGLMIVTMPYTRLYKDVCSMFAKHLKNIHIVKAGFTEFDSFGLVHIIGQKDTAKLPREDEYKKLRRLFDASAINNYSSLALIDDYILPNTGISIDLFKGSALDIEELNDLITKSNLMDKIWEGQKVAKTGENIKNPLLPFNIGQLGLVLTSGCLDGIVDEGNNNYHLIKGRVSKHSQYTTEEQDGNISTIETTINKVEINVLLPNGSYKTLA